MSENARLMIKGAVKAFLYGCAIGAVVMLVAFSVGWLAGSSANWVRGYEWAIDITYLLGAVGMLVGSICMFSSGGKSREEQLDPNNYEVPPSFKRVPGISWPVALLWGSLGVLVVPGVVETVFYALF